MKSLQYHISCKSVWWEPHWYVWTDRRMDMTS